MYADTDSGTCAVRGATCGRMYDTPNHDQVEFEKTPLLASYFFIL